MPKHARDEDEMDDIEVDEAPTSIDPYQVLGLETDASQDDIKKAYRKAALKHHPDKAAAEDKDAAHTKFQEIAFAFAILSDERRRKRYDTTGRTEESLDLEDDDFNWTDFFRNQFKDVVTEEKISEFEDKYKGSEEERQAVLDTYTKHKGKMTKLYQEVMLSDMVQDEDRFREIIDAAIEAGEVESYQAYTGESEKQRKSRIATARRNKKDEAPEAEELQNKIRKKSKKENGDAAGGMGDLAALIRGKQAGRAENFLDRLEEKYAPKAKKGKKSAAVIEEPPEEMFERNRAPKKAKR